VDEDADDVGAEDDADIGAAPSPEWRQRDDGGFGGKVEPMGEGAEEEVYEGAAGLLCQSKVWETVQSEGLCMEMVGLTPYNTKSKAGNRP